MQETVRGSLDEVRQVARRLRPGVLEDLGLRSAVTALATDFTAGQRRAGDVAGSTQRLPALSADAELVLYRIAQEGLTNVARHADATRVELSLTRQAGRGGAAHHRRRPRRRRRDEGAGIRGMRERAILVGGHADRRAAPAGGPAAPTSASTVPADDQERTSDESPPGSCSPTTTPWSAADCG